MASSTCPGRRMSPISITLPRASWTVGAAAPKLHVPALFVVSQNDPTTSVTEITDVYKSVPGSPKKLLVLSPDGGHGWDTLNYDGPAGNVQKEIDNFLAAHD